MLLTITSVQLKYLPKNEYTIENKEDVNGKNDNNMISGVASDTQKCIIKKLNDNGLNTEAGLSYSSDDIEFYFEILRGFVKEYSWIQLQRRTFGEKTRRCISFP